MAIMPVISPAGLSQQQLDLIQQFEANYNAVDHYLRGELQSTRQASFTGLVAEYSKKHPGWPDQNLLRTIAEVRNAIVHGKTEPYRYVAMPTPTLAAELQRCRNRLISPDLVIPKFQKRVEIIASDDPLAKVLRLVHERHYSQFPVYDGAKFKGLLTENGITRWLARHVSGSLSLVEFEEISVLKVIREEEKPKSWKFVARDARVDDLIGLFSTSPLLEATLITASGKESEKLLGITTRWDVLQVL